MITYYLLLKVEDIVVEKLVQLFICEVDAELLKGIDLRERERKREIK